MKNREQLIDIFKSTIEDIQCGGYETDERAVDFPGEHKMLRETKMYRTIGKVQGKSSIYKDTKIYVQNIDTFEKAREFGSDCVVLNMASSKRPGGGVETGSRAQEEELCRRSNLIQSLYMYSPEKWDEYFSEGYNFPKKYNTLGFTYPIPTYGGIYSPSVCVYKEPNTYKLLEIPFSCNVISVAGVVRPEIDSSTGKMLEKYASIVKGKIRTILRIAIDNNHAKIVLGALGCGAFKNPPFHVAKLFKEVLGESEFMGMFEEICFAILEDNNSGKEHNPLGNLKPFIDVFGEYERR